MRLFTGHIFCWNNSSYLASIFRHSSVHDTGPPIRCLFNKQYLFTFNHRCSGCWWQYLTIEENWNNKHWTKTTGNRQYRRMITVTVHNYRLAKYWQRGWKMLTINVSSKNFSLQNIWVWYKVNIISMNCRWSLNQSNFQN